MLVKVIRLATPMARRKTAEIVVPRGVPVVRLAPGRPAMLKRGRAVIVFAGRAPGGGLTAARLLVESGGVKPPM